MFTAWSRATSYFSADRKSRLSDMIRDGDDGTFEFTTAEAYFESHSDEDEDADVEEGGSALGQGVLDHERDADDEMSNGCSETSDTRSVSTTAEDPLVLMSRCHSLEERLREHKPEDIDEVEEQQILQILRWIFQHDAKKRPTVDEILAHPWLHV